MSGEEADHYEKYAADRDNLRRRLKPCTWRQNAGPLWWTFTKTEEQKKKAEEAKAKTIALTQRIVQQYPRSDWAARARAIDVFGAAGCADFREVRWNEPVQVSGHWSQILGAPVFEFLTFAQESLKY